MNDELLAQASLAVTRYLQSEVETILATWKKRKPLHLFLEFHFPFVNRKVQKVLMERAPFGESASQWLRDNPRYPINAYLMAEAIAWISCGPKNGMVSLFPLTEMVEWFQLNDLQWFSKLLATVADAIETQIEIDPKSPMPKALQAWCLERDKLQDPAKQWLQGTPDGDDRLAAIGMKNENPDRFEPIRIPPVAGQENGRRRKIFKKWADCWRAELDGLQGEIDMRIVP